MGVREDTLEWTSSRGSNNKVKSLLVTFIKIWLENVWYLTYIINIDLAPWYYRKPINSPNILAKTILYFNLKWNLLAIVQDLGAHIPSSVCLSLVFFDWLTDYSTYDPSVPLLITITCPLLDIFSARIWYLMDRNRWV